MKTFGGGSNRARDAGRGKARPSTAYGLKVKGGGSIGKPKNGKNMSLKNRVRALERLIRLPPERLDPKVNAIKTAELLELKKELGGQDRSEMERKLAKRYHHVKFFERIKIERAISKLERKIKAGGGGEGDSQHLDQLREDLEYVLNFPAGERYVSLLKDATDASSQAHLDSERGRLRALIKVQMKESALVNEADEGKSIRLPAILPVPRARADLKGNKGGLDPKVEKMVLGDKGVSKEEGEDDFFLGPGVGEGEGEGEVKASKSSHYEPLLLQDDEEEEEEEEEEDRDEEEKEGPDASRVSSHRGARGARSGRSHSTAPRVRGSRGGEAQAGGSDEGKRKRSEGGRKRRKCHRLYTCS